MALFFSEQLRESVPVSSQREEEVQEEEEETVSHHHFLPSYFTSSFHADCDSYTDILFFSEVSEEGEDRSVFIRLLKPLRSS